MRKTGKDHSRHSIFKIEKNRKFPPTSQPGQPTFLQPLNSTPRLHKRLRSEQKADYPLLRLSQPPKSRFQLLPPLKESSPIRLEPPNLFKSLPPTPMESRSSISALPIQTASRLPTPSVEEDRSPSTRDEDKIPVQSQTPIDLELGNPQTERSHRSPTSLKPPSATSPLWNSSHPCFPHVNSHVPLSSPLIKTTRIIRIPRNWMAAGDLYPAFSNVYPEILAPWIREVDFRRLIDSLNTQLEYTFQPAGLRVWMDGIMGCLTGWLWEDFGLTKSKSGMRQVEQIINIWNQERKADPEIENSDLVHCIQLRRTGFLCLDIVIPDPKVMVVNQTQMKQS